MSILNTQISYVLDQLELVGEVIPRKMFGGVGFFKKGKMFAMLNSKGTLLLKVGESNIQDYKDLGMAPFSHACTTTKMPYYEVPLNIVENRLLLKQWSDKSVSIAFESN